MATQIDNTTQFSKKSGKGPVTAWSPSCSRSGTSSRGHEELRAACERLATTLKNAPVELNIRTGLRDERHAIFDGGTRLVWCTTFETDWDPYVEDAIVSIGIDNFTDWLQHTTAADDWQAWIRESGGREARHRGRRRRAREAPADEYRRAQEVLDGSPGPASGYYNAMSYLTHAEASKAKRVNEAFQQVLDTPPPPPRRSRTRHEAAARSGSRLTLLIP